MPQSDRPHTARTQTYSREYGIGGAIPSPRWSKGAVGLTLLATAALIAILGALMAWRMTIEAVDRTRDVIQHAQHFWAFLDDAEMAQRGFVLTGEERDLDLYRQALPGLESEVQALRSLTAGNPGQQHRVERLDSATRHRLGELAQTIQLRRAGGEDAAIRMVRSGRGRAAGMTSASRSKAASCQASMLTNVRPSGRRDVAPRPTTSSSSSACHWSGATREVSTAWLNSTEFTGWSFRDRLVDWGAPGDT